MTVRKLPLYIEDTNYLLLGIHHSIETVQLAFFLNSFLGIQLQRTSEDVAKTSQEFFQVYEHEDVLRQQNWQLFSNKSFQDSDPSRFKTLFEQSPIVSYLVPEKKEIDSFLKFTAGSISMENCLEIVRKIPQISACYQISLQHLKSKNNLIFG